jgi:hypothetical protein
VKVQIDWNKKGHDVYDEKSFDLQFKRDLKDAKQFVLIESPYIKVERLEAYRDLFLSLRKRGVQICVFSQEPWGWDNRDALTDINKAKLKQVEVALGVLKSLGVHVTLRKGIHVKTAIIDGRIHWRGSLNILSFAHTVEEMVRFDDPVEAMRTIKRRNLHYCEECLALKKQIIQNDLSIDPGTLGKLISNKRDAAGLSRFQLARKVEFQISKIKRIESGEQIPLLGQLITLLEAVDQCLVAIPRGAKPFLEHMLQIAPEDKR